MHDPTRDVFKFVCTAQNQSKSIDVSGFDLVSVGMAVGAITNATFNFKASHDSTDGTDGTWFDCLAVRSNTGATEAATGALSATPAYTWDIGVAGYSFFKVTCSAGTFGAGNVIVGLTRVKGQPEPCPSAVVNGTVTVTGTVTANAQPVAPTTATINSAATTNAQAVRAAACTVTGLVVSNVAASARFLKIYNKATAPVIGTDVPVLVVPVPASGVVSLALGSNGLRLSAGLGIAITGAAADSDATAIAAADVKAVFSYL